MTTAAPLQRRAVLVLSVRAAVGFVLFVVGSVGAGREVALGRQAPWIAVAVAGALVAAASAALWLLDLRRTVRARVVSLLTTIDSLPSGLEAQVDDLVRVRRRDGGQLFHRPSCALVAGRAVVFGDAEGWSNDGSTACEACRA